MKTMQFEHRIAAPPDKVFAALTDFENLRDWRTLESVQIDPPGPLRVGTRITSTVKGPGGLMHFTNEVTQLDPTRRLYDDRALEGSFLIEAGFQVDAAGDESNVRWTTRFQPLGRFRLMAPFLGKAIMGGQRKDLAKLAAHLESRSQPSQ
jgi:uncharacterized protein YndB with AHSA1/START domain